MADIERMFSPKAVALIGATDKEGTVGESTLKNLLQGKGKHTVYPVNPGHEVVAGLKCYPNIASVPGHVDLAVIATPAKSVPEVVEECGKAGVDGIVIISAGFREIGAEGAKLEAEISAIRAKYGFRILGPNCVGFARPSVRLNATFLKDSPEPGSIAFISQSGALGSAILDWATVSHVGFSLFASMGSMLDLDFGDLIDFLGTDPNTRSIIVYVEGIGNAKKFMSAARGFARTKPIVVLKAGKYTTGAKAVQSHTGALAGDFEVYDAAFKRVGVLRVNEIGDLFNCASVLDSRRLPSGPKLAIVTNAGGPGVLASDKVTDLGGELAKLSDSTMKVLNEHLPPYWSRGNPVDVLGDADVSRYELAMKALLEDSNVDGILAMCTPQGVTPATDLASMVVKESKDKHKPVLTVWMGEKGVADARRKFAENSVPSYSTPEEAIKTYMYMYRYRRNLDLLYETPNEVPVDLMPPNSHLRLMVRKAIADGKLLLSQADADKFLDAYNIPRLGGGFARGEEEALMIARRVGYPIVLKIVSQDIVHKSDIGGVIVNITNSETLAHEYNKLIDRVKILKPEAKIDGVYVQKMAKNVDYELILGSKKDRDFGAVLLFGSGGIGVELFRDFAIGLPPINQVLARRMMEETTIYKALSKGLRNRPPANLKALEEVIIRFSSMIADFPEIAEMDVNPLSVAEGKVFAVDVRILLDQKPIDRSIPYPHMVILPYPTKYVVPWKLEDGTDVLLRPIRPEDEAMESEFINGLSEETNRYRFFNLVRNLPHSDLVRFCNIDYDREMAIVAEITEGGRRREIGVGRLIAEPDRRRGEFAVVIADQYQTKGLGRKLVDMLIDIAEERRFESIFGVVLRDNAPMLSLCREMGFSVKYEEDYARVELALRVSSSQSVAEAQPQPQPQQPAKPLVRPQQESPDRAEGISQ
ncbi:MAG TPA: bifunctional acetate--CoA ligase family protein/GNAT family N-acetyltransferase [Nitrososphaerales archaeon]|nr:bifunctional acetate--CoA ligase family protein/GNAT family N-acetyltransferase [Nitrososphaerales archaeon]